jgi:hypothetical protein
LSSLTENEFVSILLRVPGVEDVRPERQTIIPAVPWAQDKKFAMSAETMETMRS